MTTADSKSSTRSWEDILREGKILGDFLEDSKRKSTNKSIYTYTNPSEEEEQSRILRCLGLTETLKNDRIPPEVYARLIHHCRSFEAEYLSDPYGYSMTPLGHTIDALFSYIFDLNSCDDAELGYGMTSPRIHELKRKLYADVCAARPEMDPRSIEALEIFRLNKDF